MYTLLPYTTLFRSVAEGPAAQFDVQFLAGLRIKPRAQPAEGDFPERNQHEADGEHLQRGQAVMRQHLVDDILEEERRGETEQVERAGNQQHFADQFPVLDDLGNEPGQVEGGSGDLRAVACGDRGWFYRPAGPQLGRTE